MPYHEAEQRNKKQKNDSEEHPFKGCDISRRLLYMSSAGQPGGDGPAVKRRVIGCLFFWFVFFGQAKKMNIPKLKLIFSLLILLKTKAFICAPKIL